MAKLTLSLLYQVGDIPTIEFIDEDEFDYYLSYVHRAIDVNSSVFVCFNAYEWRNHENRYTSFLITKNANEVIERASNINKHEHFSSKDFNIFCFKNYEEAFKYCSDLKEGY